VNYGSFGVIAGHELAHALDANGRRVAVDGRNADWWDADSVAALQSRAACLKTTLAGQQVTPAYRFAHTYVPATRVDPELTINETIADLAGVEIAYDAYRAAVSPRSAAPALVPGLTNDQLFFVSYAQTWCTMEGWIVPLDPHAPPAVRVNAVLAQMPRFSAAFQCPEESPMRRQSWCPVW
jgi:putative endopeptidase